VWQPVGTAGRLGASLQQDGGQCGAQDIVSLRHNVKLFPLVSSLAGSLCGRPAVCLSVIVLIKYCDPPDRPQHRRFVSNM